MSTLLVEAAVRRRATLSVRDGADALVRVLVTLRRRGCVVEAVDYGAGDRHRPGWLSVSYVPPVRHGHAVASWLSNLVDVLEVEDVAL
jgi:acetolactate synthase regulatory subunit